MAPIVRDAENSAEPPAPSAPPPNTPKGPQAGDGSTRTQPVALEIPVTVNGARTLEGSDKREPFSETTKTVLIFNQGAVIRIATPVAAGQLVFLTNEKTKKEVVCQVVKSKSGGGPASGYVELQFTEPAVGFWGMRFPAAPATAAPTPVSAALPPRPAANAPVAPSATPAPSAPQSAPAAAPPPPPATVSSPAMPGASAPPPALPKAVPPTPPVASSPTTAQPPTTAPPKSAVAPPSGPAVKSEPPKPVVPAPTTPAPVSFVPPPAPLPPVAPPSQPEAKRTPGVPEIHDYSKEIAAIFAVPPVGSTKVTPTNTTPAAPTQPPASPEPSTDELKQQTARLQAQLSSLLFSEAAAPPASSPAPPVPLAKSPANKPEPVLESSSQKAHSQPPLPPDSKPAAKLQPKPVPSAPKSKSYDIEQVEEVKVPDWLAPLSRNPESLPASTPAPTEQSRIPGWLAPLSHIAQSGSVPQAPSAGSPTEVAPVSASPAEQLASHSLSALESEGKSEDASFGGNILDESLESASEPAAAGGSKKGLFLGLAAAALLLAGGGVWYMRQTHGGNSARPAAKAVEAPVSSQTAAVANIAGNKPELGSVVVSSNPSSLVASPASAQPSKNSPVNAASVSLTPAAALRGATPPAAALPARSEPPAAVQPKKPSLGQVHLSAPVVNRGAKSDAAEADPSLGASVPAGGAESLSALSGGGDRAPAAPLAVGGDAKAARLVKSVPPVYPQMARTQRIAGNVSIDAVVDADGNVSSAKVLSGPALLHRAALDAVQQWHYEPATLDGKPTATHLTVIVQFRLQ